jgi:diguanylate cyclase (GGDEF)-like protein/putative nucleotidyltransferase with HDIG domain
VPLSNLLFGIAAVFTVWAFLLFRLAQNIINSMVLTDRKRQHNSFSEFQTTVTSVLDEKELFRVAAESLCQMIPKGRVLVFLRKEEAEEFALFELTEEDYGLEPEKEQEILQYFHEEDFEKHVEMAPLQYDHTMQGFIYILLPDKVKLNYVEVEYLQQIAAHSSVCLKNIHLYQTAYQNSIHDELTGLYNRRYYKEFIEKYWMPHEPQAIVYIDMDDFRLLNEVYGEDRADEVVCWCADIIREETESKGAIFRFGSNEFLIYFRYQKEEELRMVAQKIQKRLADDKERKPDVLQPVTVSIGIAMYPDTAQDADSLLKQAERATFFAKEDGKNCFRVYTMEEKRASVTEEGKAYQQIAQTIYALVAAIDAKDSFTFEHSVHVSEYAVLLAQAIGLDDSEVRIVQEAGMLHDIGKIGIPDDILKKPGRLTKEEYETMKTHVMNSIDMIHYLPNMNYVIPAVISHHERYDGKGYPRGLAGEDIPLLGRVLAVCDCYDAMVSKRAYKESMSKEYAASELEANKGIQFDPKLADAFITLIKEGKV